MNYRHSIPVFIFLVLLGIAGCGGGGGGGNAGAGNPTPVATPSPTAVGEPADTAVSATIGAAGGSLSTADGKIVLTVPAGALAADTVVGIQPLTNMAHGKIGAAYRLTPDGQQFLMPVTLTFPYTDQDLQGTAAEFLGAAFQTAEGFWQWAGDPTIDTTAKTMSVRTTHFSDWSLVMGVQIRPPSKSVKVGGTVALRVDVCYPVTIDAELASLAYKCDGDEPDAPPMLNRVSDWSVNGALGGSGATGTVVSTGNTNATYTAPATQPSPNTVAVSARVDTGKGKTLVVSNITVVDGFNVYTGTFSSKFTSPAGESQIDAVVRFTLSDVASDGTRTYVGSGSAQLGGSLTNCVWDGATGDMLPVSGLIVFPDGLGPLANRYTLVVAAQAMSTLRCTGSPPTSGPLQVSHDIGADLPCEPPSTNGDPSGLTASYACSLPNSAGELRANWALKAQ